MTRSDAILAIFALSAGAMLPLQALINGRLGNALGSPLWASQMQNIVGCVAMAAVVLISRTPVPAGDRFVSTPPWLWIGGVLGVTYVFIALLAAPRLGTTRAMTAIIAGQLIASVLLDHFGVLHARRPATWESAVGVLLLAAGAVLVLRKA